MLSHEEMIVRLIMAALLGGVIGFERERIAWAAGLRTHMLVAVGSCLVMIVSAFGFADVRDAHGFGLDPSRMAAQVVSGIGFLGAGSILLRGEVIKGLTTAASLWTVSAIGLAIGGGMYYEASAATGIIFVILAGLKPFEDRFHAMRGSDAELRVIALRGSFSLASLHKIIGRRVSKVKQFAITPSETNDIDEIKINLSPVSAGQIAYIINELKKLPDVRDVVQTQS